jgi:hypothetical protein
VEHAWGPWLHVCQRLADIFGRNGALILVCLVFVVIVLLLAFSLFFGYLVLHFGEATSREAIRFVFEALKVFRYQPKQKTHLSIRIELYIDSALALTFVLSLIGLLAHALIPWVTERSEDFLFAAFISSFVVFAYLATVSIKIAARLPREN